MDYLDRIPDGEPETEISALLKELAQVRRDNQAVKEKADELLEKFQNTGEYAELCKTFAWLTIQQKTIETQIREAALRAGAKLPKAVAVKTFKEVVIGNVNEVKEWCIKNFSSALKVDTKVIETAAKTGLLPTEIAQVQEVKRAQIATDLSAYLPLTNAD